MPLERESVPVATANLPYPGLMPISVTALSVPAVPPAVLLS